MKLHYCFLERFNNYFNRKIIKYDTLLEYQNNSKSFFIPEDTHGAMMPFDFNPNDNVMTEIIANEVPFDPDYFLLLDDDSNIVQRWFVLEQKRNRQGQWLYQLRRDVVSDNLDNLADAPIFVQKGMLPEDDPMIFNGEGMSFNQIKTNETLLQDRTKSAWIICYLAKNLASADVPVDVPAQDDIPEYYTLSQIASDLGITEATLIDVLNFDPNDNKVLKITNSLSLSYVCTELNENYTGSFGISSDFATVNTGSWTRYWGDASSFYLFFPRIMNNFRNQIRANASALLSGMSSFLGRDYYLQSSLASSILSRYAGKYILYLGRYYQLNITDTGVRSTTKNFKPSTYPTWDDICEDTITAEGSGYYNKAGGEANLTLNENEFRLYMADVASLNKTYHLNISSARRLCTAQEFDMVAIPASDIGVETSGDQLIQTGDLAQKLASALAIKEGTNIYDVQLLPFCPRPDIIKGDNYISVATLTENLDFDYITTKDDDDNDVNVGVAIYVDKASFTNQIILNLTLKDNMKIDSQCDFYRIVSPNYQGSFEFNVAKNGGTVEFFSIYCTYKPYTPFIKVTPDLQYVYGSDYNDNRGLICGGDFSLPRASSAWEQYQLENKNYQNIFNREIQNLDFMQSIEMRNQLVSGAVGMVSDTAKGAGAGAYVGGGMGAVVGGALGLSASMIGYGIDTDTLAKTQREIKQLAVDKFNYQLGNIKALPYTLTKVGAFDISSKIFPILEYYTCTDKEKQALKDKIRWESMTVMRIGTLREFMNFGGEINYFKGELIRNDLIADDSHILNAIYEELLKGVYI